ncbi:MAG: hypothetical protein CSA66_06610 [Proteobacteria bacterium]|nr:MAG: hypothetical protein CSA66_06610 [Pseudomonadota bacterium]
MSPVPAALSQIGSVRDLRRAQILDEARRLVSEGGLQALTFAALEARLSFTRGVITYHFDNKAEIVDAVLDSAVEEIDRANARAVMAAGAIEDKLRAVIAHTVGGFIEHVEAGRILLNFWARLPRDQHAARINARLYRRYREHSVALLRAGQRLGRFRADVDVEALAAHMVGTVIGIVTQSYFEPGAIDPDAAVAEAVATLLARLRVAG